MSSTALPAHPAWRAPLNGILFVGLFAAAVVQIAAMPALRSLGFSPLVVGIVAGMLYGNFVRSGASAGWDHGVHLCARKLLRIAVAFYGLNISFQQIASVGVSGLLVSASVVISTLVAGTWIGRRWLGMDRDTAMLTAAGSAICGAAAVLAFESTLRNAPHKSAVAVATVVLFGTLSMFLYPILFHMDILGLDAKGWGLFVGGTIHEVAQVVAAGSAMGAEALETATIVKMTRVAILVPVLVVLGVWLRSRMGRGGEQDSQAGGGKIPVPWFLLGFLLLAGINSLGIVPEDIIAAARRLDVFALTMAMTALGMETRFGQIKRAGPRALALAGVLYAWLLIGGYGITIWAM